MTRESELVQDQCVSSADIQTPLALRHVSLSFVTFYREIHGGREAIDFAVN